MISQEELPTSLEHITGYLLKVETLLNEKAALVEDLAKNQAVWAENDQIILERKTTLKDALRISSSLLTKKAMCEHTEFTENYKMMGEHENALFYIDEIFIRNRERSVEFMKQVA